MLFRSCVALLGKGCCVVDLAGCERYANVISSQGVAAIVGDVADDTLKVDADAADGATLPAFAIGTRSDGTQVWLEYVSGSGGTYERCRPPRADDVRRFRELSAAPGVTFSRRGRLAALFLRSDMVEEVELVAFSGPTAALSTHTLRARAERQELV